MAMPFNRSDFGTPTLNRHTADRNELARIYRSANRDLRRAQQRSRDPGTIALQRIELLKKAEADGIQVNGIRRFEDRRAADVATANQSAQNAADLAQDTARKREKLGYTDIGAEDGEAERVSFDDAAANAMQARTLAGAFGEGAKRKLQRENLEGFAKGFLPGGMFEGQDPGGEFWTDHVQRYVGKGDFRKYIEGARQKRSGADALAADTARMLNNPDEPPAYEGLPGGEADAAAETAAKAKADAVAKAKAMGGTEKSFLAAVKRKQADLLVEAAADEPDLTEASSGRAGLPGGTVADEYVGTAKALGGTAASFLAAVERAKKKRATQ